jgi:hypothetical protein
MSKYNVFYTNYEGRLLLLVENINSKKVIALYRSAGRTDTSIKKAGEIFPILTILDEGVLGHELNAYYPNMSDGWIVKFVTKEGRNDINSYFGSENIRKFCIKMEKWVNEKINIDNSTYVDHKLGFHEWIHKLDSFYLSKEVSFISSLVMRHLKKPEAVR